MRENLPPELDIPFVRAFVEPLEALSDRANAGQFDGSQPVTEMQAVFEAIERGMQGLSEEDGRAALFQVLRAAAANERLKPAEDAPPTGWKAKVFASYLAGADGATVILLVGELLRRPQRQPNLMRSAYLLEQAARLQGERLAYAVSDAFHRIAEPLFRDTVRVLYQLECARQNTPMRKETSFGTALADARRWLPAYIKGFLDPEASRLRNAEVHDGWLYLAPDGVIQAGKTRLTPTRALVRARKLLSTIVAIEDALQWRAAQYWEQTMAASPIATVKDPKMYDDDARVEALARATWNHVVYAVRPAQQHLRSLSWPVWPA